MRVFGLILILCATVGCRRAPGIFKPPEVVVEEIERKDGVEGELLRGVSGAQYTDKKYGFVVRAPSGWITRVNFEDEQLRVRFEEQDGLGATPCGILVRVAPEASEGRLREILGTGGDVFYFDTVTPPSTLEAPLWAFSIDKPGGERSEVGYATNWRANAILLIGAFPSDRVSICKRVLDEALARLRLLDENGRPR